MVDQVELGAERVSLSWPLLAGGMVLGGLALLSSCRSQPEQQTRLEFPGQILIGRVGPRTVHLPVKHRFPQPVDLTVRRAALHLRFSPDLERDAVVQVYARDRAGRQQWTEWTLGQPLASNGAFDPSSRVLTLEYQATPANIARQGRTDEGFDPARIDELGLWVNVRDGDGKGGKLEILGAELNAAAPLTGAAQVRPLLRTEHRPPNPTPLHQLKSGVSRYFLYGDFHQWEGAEPIAERTFREQQENGMSAFRSMGALGLGGGKLGPETFQAMRSYLELASRHGQNVHIFTLLDGAIPNQTLQKAMRDPVARNALVEDLRPFIQEFGRARIGDQPVIFDLVNEIHGVGGVTDRQRQELVEDLVELFVEEAPSATLTVGVQNFRELAYWTYLPEKFAGKPVRFVMTFHLYEDVDNLPPAWQLNLPEGVEVGITEANPNQGMENIVRKVSEKGYSWLLFWQDSSHRYVPRAHRRDLDRLAPTQEFTNTQ